jgi:DNA-directed RNA polymerase specialized sigma24 family protein
MNKWIDRKRGQKRKPLLIPLEDHHTSKTQTREDMVACLDNTTIIQDIIDFCETCMQTGDNPQRASDFLEHFIEGNSYQDIADASGRKEDTVKTNVSRFKLHLKKYLIDKYWDNWNKDQWYSTRKHKAKK